MKINDLTSIINGEVLCGFENLTHEVHFAFACDLMSDVLTIKQNNVLLITGLSNVQTIRTAEMSDINCVIIVRNKDVSKEMIRLAKESEIVLIKCKYSMFRTSGLLFSAGIKPIF